MSGQPSKQDIQRYASTGHLPRGLVARIDMLHMAAFKRLKRIKDGK